MRFISLAVNEFFLVKILTNVYIFRIKNLSETVFSDKIFELVLIHKIKYSFFSSLEIYLNVIIC